MTECRTDGTSAFNTRTVQRRLLLLDPARGKERVMEIQQHDGVVVDVAGLRRATPSFYERERCCRGGGRRPRLLCSALPPPLYIGPLGGRRPQEMRSQGGAAATRGERACLAPQGKGELPPRVLNPRRMGGRPKVAPQPIRGWFPSTFSPRGPPGQVAPPGGPPGPFRWSRYNTDNPRNFPGGRNWTSYI